MGKSSRKPNKGVGATMNSSRCRRLLTAALVLCCACTPTKDLGSRYVKAADVKASEGGTLAVTASDSAALAGAELHIAPGALAADTRITLELGDAPLTTGADQGAGPTAVWGPAGTVFSAPVE